MYKLLLIWGSTLLFKACETGSDIHAESKIEVKENESKSFTFDGKAAEIKLREIQDSRCPKNVNCVRAGEAIVRFDLKLAGNTSKGLELCLDCESTFNIPQSTSVNNYTIKLLDVNPYPVADTLTTSRTVVLSLQ